MGYSLSRSQWIVQPAGMVVTCLTLIQKRMARIMSVFYWILTVTCIWFAVGAPVKMLVALSITAWFTASLASVFMCLYYGSTSYKIAETKLFNQTASVAAVSAVVACVTLIVFLAISGLR